MRNYLFFGGGKFYYVYRKCGLWVDNMPVFV